MSNTQTFLFDVRYRANTKMELLRRCKLNALKRRELEGRYVLSVTSYDKNRIFNINVGDIEWVKFQGHIFKLRAPKSRSLQRMQELKNLLVDHPAINSVSEGGYVENKPGSTGKIVQTAGHVVTGTIGLAFLMLPGGATVLLVVGIIYTMIKMAHVIH